MKQSELNKLRSIIKEFDHIRLLVSENSRLGFKIDSDTMNKNLDKPIKDLKDLYTNSSHKDGDW